MLNSDSRKRSAVGRISRDDGDASVRPFNRPPTTRITLRRHPEVLAAMWGEPRRMGHTRLQPSFETPRKMRGCSGRRLRLSERSASLFQRLQIALAVVAALRAARRAVAVGLEFVALARLLAARALHQHAAAL